MGGPTASTFTATEHQLREIDALMFVKGRSAVLADQ
jgi:hypothetical protein